MRSSLLSARLASSALSVLVFFVPGAVFAQNKMPPVAPSIDRSLRSAPTVDAPSAGVSTTFVQPKLPVDQLPEPAPQRAVPSQPLQAAAAKFGAEPLNGQVGKFGGGANSLVGYMATTVPGASASHTVPAAVFRAWLEKTHPQFALTSSRISSAEVVDVTGHWDDAGKTLTKLGIPCTRISTGDLRTYPLEQAKVLIVNCAGFMNRDCLQRIRDFVIAGGYLLTTDWAIDNVVQGAFPGYIAYNHKRNHRLEYVSEVSDPDPILFQNTVSSANWKCETGCHLVTVQKPALVRVIVRSRELSGEDGEGVLAATFPFGKGQVLHLVGHFDNNQGMFRMGDTLPDPAPIIGIALRQAIASNFVVAGLCSVPIPARQHAQAR